MLLGVVDPLLGAVSGPVPASGWMEYACANVERFEDPEAQGRARPSTARRPSSGRVDAARLYVVREGWLGPVEGEGDRLRLGQPGARRLAVATRWRRGGEEEADLRSGPGRDPSRGDESSVLVVW